MIWYITYIIDYAMYLLSQSGLESWGLDMFIDVFYTAMCQKQI